MKFVLSLVAVTALMAQDRRFERLQGPSGSLRKGDFSAQLTGKASIEGNVLDAATREPVKKASVSLGGAVGLMATTDASGHFAFRDLPAGKYTIRANSDKYPPPRPGIDVEQLVSISLAADDQKNDVSLVLTPGATVRGRVLDEEGTPMPGCSVTLMRFQETEDGRTFSSANGVQTDQQGEYRISSVSAGKYYVLGRCPQSVVLPHALVRRNASTTMDLPMLSYAPQFYPGVPDPTGATRIEAAPNANLTGIDFRMVPAAGVTVRGRVGSGSNPGGRLQIGFQPRDPLRREWQRQNPRFNSSTGEFQILNVVPGSYELTATGMVDGGTVFARVPVEVGQEPLARIDVALNPAPALSGTVFVEGDAKLPAGQVRVIMQPLDYRSGMFQAAPAEVKSDGTFTISSILPGRWRMIVSGIPGYVKSVTQGDQEVSQFDLEVGQSGGGPLKIVVGTLMAQVEATISNPPTGTEPATAVVWAVKGDPNFRQTLAFGSQAHMTFNLAPGKYFACAIIDSQPWMLLQNRALRKALESVCQTVDIPETGRASLQLALISAADLKRLMDKLEE